MGSGHSLLLRSSLLPPAGLLGGPDVEDTRGLSTLLTPVTFQPPQAPLHRNNIHRSPSPPCLLPSSPLLAPLRTSTPPPLFPRALVPDARGGPVLRLDRTEGSGRGLCSLEARADDQNPLGTVGYDSPTDSQTHGERRTPEGPFSQKHA